MSNTGTQQPPQVGVSELNVQLYCVSWMSKLTGATGHGKPTIYDIAEAAVIDANKRLGKEFNHWTERV